MSSYKKNILHTVTMKYMYMLIGECVYLAGRCHLQSAPDSNLVAPSAALHFLVNYCSLHPQHHQEAAKKTAHHYVTSYYYLHEFQQPLESFQLYLKHLLGF